MLQTIGKCIRVSWDKGLSTGGLLSIIPQARVSTWKERRYDISLVWLLLWSTGLSLTGQSEELQGWALTSCSSELYPHNTMSYNKNIYMFIFMCSHTHTHTTFTSGSWHRAPQSIIPHPSHILKLSNSQHGKKMSSCFIQGFLSPPPTPMSKTLPEWTILQVVSCCDGQSSTMTWECKEHRRRLGRVTVAGAVSLDHSDSVHM